jgi:hypothetical protein
MRYVLSAELGDEKVNLFTRLKRRNVKSQVSYFCPKKPSGKSEVFDAVFVFFSGNGRISRFFS